MPTCKRCQAPIRWGKRPGMKPYEKGCFVPLEPDPDPHGLYELRDGCIFATDVSADSPKYVPHEVFCTASERPRRRAVTA